MNFPGLKWFVLSEYRASGKLLADFRQGRPKSPGPNSYILCWDGNLSGNPAVAGPEPTLNLLQPGFTSNCTSRNPDLGTLLIHHI